MVIGNTQAQQVLKTYLDRIHDEGVVPFPFLLLHGPQHVGKTTLVEEKIHELLGSHVQTDYMPVYDLSAQMEKNHAIKVEVDDKDQLQEFDGVRYVDRGTRDIVSRLALAPVGKFKVVFLENIERMTGSAANAFLKTLEEPLPGRLIIATTAHKELLLDTILSRAFLISFQLPSLHEVKETIKERYPDMSDKMRAFVASFSLGRLGYAKAIADETELLEEQADAFMKLIKLIDSKKSIVDQYKLLQWFAQQGRIEHLIDAVLYTFEKEELTQADRWLHARKLLRTNVGEDNVLFNLALP